MRNSSKGNNSNKIPNPGSQKKITVINRTNSGLKQKPINSSNEKPKQKITTMTNIPKQTLKPPTNISKPPSQKVQYPGSQKYSRKKEQMKQLKWSFLPANYLMRISHYACTNLYEVYQLSKVCSLWRGHMMSQTGCFFWNCYKQGQNVQNFAKLKQYLQKYIVDQQQKMSFQFQKHFIKLFNYGSTKENIPNKLIQKLNLQLEVKLNNLTFIQPFKLRTFNFSSYLCAKIQQIKDFKYDFYTPHNMFKDKITVQMIFKSRKYKVSYNISKKYVPEQIVDGAIKQKAFNYFLDKNFVFTYFQGDNHFLYIFFQISVLELVNIFRSIIKNKHQQSLGKKVKKLPLYKQLCQTEFQDFKQYIRSQADFEIHFSYHNSLKQIFTHCDTKVYPVQYDNKHAYFDIKVDDSFDKVATYKLDNKMGMSQSIQDLFLLDFILKDRDRFLIIFSGFIYARNATQKQRQSIQNYFDFAENNIKIIQSKQPKFTISFMIIEEAKKNLMKNVTFTLFS